MLVRTYLNAGDTAQGFFGINSVFLNSLPQSKQRQVLLKNGIGNPTNNMEIAIARLE
jgi:hypothetical protein